MAPQIVPNPPHPVLVYGCKNFAGHQCRDTFPAAFHYFSTTGEDWWGFLGTHGDNESEPNPLRFIELTTKVARRRRFSKRAGSGSIPVATLTRSVALPVLSGLSAGG